MMQGQELDTVNGSCFLLTRGSSQEIKVLYIVFISVGRLTESIVLKRIAPILPPIKTSLVNFFKNIQ